MTEQTWLLIGLAGLVAGMVINLSLGGRRTAHEEAHSMVHGLVPMIAASAYFAMAAGQGGATLGDGRHLWWARYADWSVTTPLLLLGLSLTATHSGFRRPGLVMGLLIADVFMIVTALFFGLTTTFWIRWTWFLISTVAFFAILWVIWGPLREEARREKPEVQAVYARNAGVLTALWLAYPAVLAFGADGLGYVGPVASTGAIAVLDVLAKTGFGLMAVTASRRLTGEDLAERRHERGPARARTPSFAQPAPAG